MAVANSELAVLLQASLNLTPEEGAKVMEAQWDVMSAIEGYPLRVQALAIGWVMMHLQTGAINCKPD